MHVWNSVQICSKNFNLVKVLDGFLINLLFVVGFARFYYVHNSAVSHYCKKFTTLHNKKNCIIILGSVIWILFEGNNIVLS